MAPNLRHFYVFLWGFFIYASSAVYTMTKTGETSYANIDLYVGQILLATSLSLFFSVVKLFVDRSVNRLFYSPYVWLMGYAAVAFITVPLSPDPLFTLVKASQFLAVVLLAVAAVSSPVRGGDAPKRLLNATYAALAICMLLAWGVAIVSPEVGAYVGTSTLRIGRFTFHYTTRMGRLPFHYTTVAGMASVLVIAFLVRLQSKRNTLNLCVFIFALGTLLATRARMSTAFVFIGIPVVLLIYRRWRWVFGCVAVGVGAVSIPMMRAKIMGFVTRGTGLEVLMDLNGRVSAWKYGLERFLDHPLVGHGYYTGSRYLLHEGYTKLTLKQFHNDMVTILFNTGLLGLFCILAVYYVSVSGMIMLARRNPVLRDDAIEVVAVLFVVFATGLLHSSIGWDAWYMMFVFVAAAVTSANYSHSGFQKGLNLEQPRSSEATN